MTHLENKVFEPKELPHDAPVPDVVIHVPRGFLWSIVGILLLNAFVGTWFLATITRDLSHTKEGFENHIGAHATLVTEEREIRKVLDDIRFILAGERHEN